MKALMRTTDIEDFPNICVLLVQLFAIHRVSLFEQEYVFIYHGCNNSVVFKIVCFLQGFIFCFPRFLETILMQIICDLDRWARATVNED